MAKSSRIIKSIPKWLLAEYLEEIGGKSDGDGQITGKGWVVYLEQIEPFQIGSLSVGQVRLTIQGEAAAVEETTNLLEPKILRAGG